MERPRTCIANVELQAVRRPKEARLDRNSAAVNQVRGPGGLHVQDAQHPCVDPVYEAQVAEQLQKAFSKIPEIKPKRTEFTQNEKALDWGNYSNAPCTLGRIRHHAAAVRRAVVVPGELQPCQFVSGGSY